MTKKIENQEEIVVAEAVSKTEKFFEENGKKVIIAIVALLLLVAGGYAYKYLVMDKNEVAAAEMIVAAQDNFAGETPNYDLALNGDEAGAGFLAVAEQYGSTKAGNLACAYAGLAYYAKGEYAEAQNYLSKFSANEAVILPAITATIGNALVNMDKFEEAAKYFEKAAKDADNDLFSPLYLMKAANVYEKLGDKAAAMKVYEQIKKQYPTSQQAATVDALIERAK